jgi:drug/metabolite transporter (DMT)-like permease
VLWGTADYLAGNLSKRFKALAVTGVSQVFGLIFGVSAILLFSDFISPNLSMDGYFLPGIIAGIAGFIGLTAFYTGLATGRMGVVSPISSLSVVIPLVFALSQGERPTSTQTLGIVIAIAGAFLASGPEVKNGLPIKPLLSASGVRIWHRIDIYCSGFRNRFPAHHDCHAMRLSHYLCIDCAAL